MTVKIPIGVGWSGIPVETGDDGGTIGVDCDPLLGDGHDNVHRPVQDRLLVFSRRHLPFGFMPRNGCGVQLATAALVAWAIEKFVALGGGWHG
jgi:hypothetical protein